MSALLHPRFWGAHLALVVAIGASVLLGVWQLNTWQAARATAARDLSDAPAKPLAAVMGGDDTFPGRDLGRPVKFTGTWLDDSTIFVQDRLLQGRRGYWVVTPVQVAAGAGRASDSAGSAMPVVRGWSPTATAPPVSGSASISGWLQPSEGSGARDDDPRDDVLPEMRIASLVERVDADLYSAFVVARQPQGPGLRAVTPQSIPPVSSLTSLRNLLYAFQWWIFGGLAIYVWQRWLRDRLELESGHDDPAPEPHAVAG